MAVTMRINEQHSGIELVFPDSERPNEILRNAMMAQGFRWHNKGKYWFARQTEERMAFASKLAGIHEKEAEPPNPEEKKSSEPKKGREPQKTAPKAAKQENTFAAVYDKIGSSQIMDGSDISIHSVPSLGIYCKDLNVFIRHNSGSYDDCIAVTDLTNAGKTGKECSVWRIYPSFENRTKGVSTLLSHDENIPNCKELVAALREGRALESVKLTHSPDKGIEVFSPFVEVKPLTKIPDEWNKRNFTNALLSGQIYAGKVNYRYTDDYAYDAAVGFRSGVGIDVPSFVRDVVEGWYSFTYLRGGEKDVEKGTVPVNFSQHSNSSKTLYFDLNCDIREGKRRAEEKAAGIKAYNSMMESSCIKIPEESIDENKIYSVTSLDSSTNDGVYGTKTEMVQGGYLLEQLREDLGYLHYLSCDEVQIIPDKLYEVANFYHPRKYAEPDDRIIDFGNSLQLVTGKALLELTAEGVNLSYITDAHGEHRSIESARENLNQFIRGTYTMMFTGLKDGGYEASLEKLNREAARAGHGLPERSSLNDLISGAKSQVSQDPQHGGKNNLDLSR